MLGRSILSVGLADAITGLSLLRKLPSLTSSEKTLRLVCLGTSTALYSNAYRHPLPTNSLGGIDIWHVSVLAGSLHG
jgi:hypothetical protein